MKISDYFRGWNGPRTVTKTDRTGDGTFQQLFDAAAQEPRDTFTLSSPAPAAEEPPIISKEPTVTPAPQTADTASATGIHPKDSIDVKLAKLRQMAEEADYTGMSYGEIYSAIWDRYNEAFDGNMPAITATIGVAIPDWDDIHTQFVDEYCHNVLYPLREEFRRNTGISVSTWSKDNYAQHERDMDTFHKYVQFKYGDLHAQALGYGGMSTEEIEQAICQKYAGKDTLRDFLNMQGELYRSGVLSNKLGSEGASAYLSAINSQLPKTYFFDEFIKGTVMDISQSRWDAALDGRFDAHAFAADMRESLKTANYSGWNFDIAGAISQGIDYLLISLDQTE